MAYVIGSQKGKDIAKSLKTGQTYKCSDGSTWTKKSDGSVSVTHNGQTYNNAYKPSSSGGSNGGGSYSGSSGGAYGAGSSGGNSQYTGYKYTIGSDYGKQVAQDMGVGTKFRATDGAIWTKENDGSITVDYNGQTYKNAYTPSDLGTTGKQQVQAGVPYQYVQNTLDERVGKALGTEGLEQYAYDDTYWMMYNYIQDQMKAENQEISKKEYEDWLEEANADRPEEYENPYKAEIDYLLNQILNRDDFSAKYDVMNDPLYQQYAQMYQREGDRAMKETMAEAAAGAGGMNTYAITAAQQANSYYNSQLNDKIPQLYQLAYDMYLNDIENEVQNLGILQNMDATQYNRYRDTLNDWYNDKNFAYGVYQDAVQQGNWQTNFDYNAMWDKLKFNNDNYLANREFNANQGQIDLENSRYDREQAEKKLEYFIKNAEMPSDELITQAGWNKADVERLVAAAKAQQVAKGTSSGGGSRSSYSSSDYTDDGGDGTPVYTATKDDGSIIGLGLGAVSKDVLEQLILADAVVVDENGNYSWANGWNSGNYKARIGRY